MQRKELKMNIAILTGYLTADPTSRNVPTKDGKEVNVTNFTIAVRDTFGENAQPQFIRVNAWRGLGDTCQKYLVKGRRVEVRGPISLNTYINKYGQPGATIEVRAEKVEFSGANPDKEEAAASEEAPELPFAE